MTKSSPQFLEEAWAVAKRTLPGWAYTSILNEARARAGGKASGAARAAWCPADSMTPVADEEKPSDEIVKASSVPSCGPVGAPFAFVCSPTQAEKLRGEPLVGPSGATFVELYLAPLGLRKSDVVLVSVEPDTSMWVYKELERLAPTVVVALGREAKDVLGERAQFSMPHPMAVRKFGDHGEIGRKIKQLKKFLDFSNLSSGNGGGSPDRVGENHAADSTGGNSSKLQVQVVKADKAKQIIYAVVLDPYKIDSHNDWICPAEIENTAHQYLKKSRVVGLQHTSVANAQVVESWIEAYPSQSDYAKAQANEPHRAFRKQFGNDIVHSGAWILGTQLDDELWAAYQRGEINAFSIGGFGVRTPIDPAMAMPKVTFVDVTVV
jgi:uracil-DNA glycosylase